MLRYLGGFHADDEKFGNGLSPLYFWTSKTAFYWQSKLETNRFWASYDKATSNAFVRIIVSIYEYTVKKWHSFKSICSLSLGERPSRLQMLCNRRKTDSKIHVIGSPTEETNFVAAKSIRSEHQGLVCGVPNLETRKGGGGAMQGDDGTN